MRTSIAACCISAALVLTAACAVTKHISQSAQTTPAVRIRLLSVIPEKRRSLSLEEFKQAMSACHFFGGNPLDDLATRTDASYSYGAICQGPGALAPEVEVRMEF